MKLNFEIMNTDGFYLPEKGYGEEKTDSDSHDYSVITLAGMIILTAIAFGFVAFAITAGVNFIFDLLTKH